VLERQLVGVEESAMTKAEGWIWYWRAGWIVGPALLILGIAIGDAALIALGIVILVLTPAIISLLRRHISD
jgi:hypothetical protein